MKILLTRSHFLNQKTAEVLSAEGHTGIECSLVKLIDTGATIPDHDFGGVIFTSQAALEILAEREKQGRLVSRSLDVFAVGKKTANSAIRLGFTNVFTGAGGAAALSELIDQRGVNGPLLYLAGIDRAFEFQKTGIALVEIYKARLVDPGKNKLHQALVEISDGCAFLYSIRTATHLLGLISQHNLEKAIENVAFIAISKSVAEVVSKLTKSTVLIADDPNQQMMIEQLGNLEKNGNSL